MQALQTSTCKHTRVYLAAQATTQTAEAHNTPAAQQLAPSAGYAFSTSCPALPTANDATDQGTTQHRQVVTNAAGNHHQRPKVATTTWAQQLGDTVGRIPACTGHQHKHIQVDAVTAMVPAIGTLIQQYSTATPCNDISIAAGGAPQLPA